MEFPEYVPAAVRAYIQARIEGDSVEPMGWAASLASAEEELARIDRAIEGYVRRGEADYPPSLRIQRADAKAHRDRLADDVDCLRRFDRREKTGSDSVRENADFLTLERIKKCPKECV